MPTPRRDFAIAVHKNKIYCIGGEVNDTSGMYFTGVNEVYDPATDTWETKASLPTPRFGMCANVVDGKIYVIGGAQYNVFPGISCSDKNEVYDPEADTWIEKTAIPVAVNGAALAVVDGRIFVLGGEAGPFGSAGWNDFNQVYDVQNDEWSTATPVPVAFDAASAGATTGVFAPKRIYVFGGFTEASYTPRNLTQVYDPENNVWSIGASMPNSQARFGVAVVNDELYAIGSANDKYTPVGHNPSSPTPSPSPSQEPASTSEAQPEPFPLISIVVIAVSCSIVGVALFVHFKKRKS
jgi:N-acetylneuraminic acid mutarotase